MKIDVIIPYCESDKHLLIRAVNSIKQQTYKNYNIITVADNTEKINIEGTISYQCNYGNPGDPVNYVVAQSDSPIIALLDADDEALHTRLENQISYINYKFQMVSSGMLQVPELNYTGTRHIAEPVIYPGKQIPTNPLGRCINSTRMLTRNLFLKLNGFSSLPYGGDYDFDNRCHYAGNKIYHDMHIEGIRYLRNSSVSNNPTTPKDKYGWTVIENIQTLRNNPTLEQSYSLGNLDKVLASLAAC